MMLDDKHCGWAAGLGSSLWGAHNAFAGCCITSKAGGDGSLRTRGVNRKACHDTLDGITGLQDIAH
jgi:hypothetical protein